MVVKLRLPRYWAVETLGKVCYIHKFLIHGADSLGHLAFQDYREDPSFALKAIVDFAATKSSPSTTKARTSTGPTFPINQRGSTWCYEASQASSTSGANSIRGAPTEDP
jgi:hypothetical protein